MRILFLLWFLPAMLNASAQEFNYYYGNLHAHTAYSDGNKDRSATNVKTPAGSFAYARTSENFDFLGISEHNHKKAGMKLPFYTKGNKETDQANKNGEFVCLYGMEYGIIKNGGHVLIYGIDQLIGWEEGNHDIECSLSDYRSLWNIIADYPGAFATLAHPEERDFQRLLRDPYNKTADDVICGVAVRTGPAFAENTDYEGKPAKRFIGYFQALLAAGYHVGPTVDHDNHNLTFGRMSASRTVVLARELHRDSLMAAFREMRFYASDDWNARVNFSINGYIMGKRINTKKDASLSVRIEDPDGEPVKSIKLFYGKPGSRQLPEVLHTVNNKTSLSYLHKAKKGEVYYYYAEITQKDGDKIITAPVWVRKL